MRPSSYTLRGFIIFFIAALPAMSFCCFCCSTRPSVSRSAGSDIAIALAMVQRCWSMRSSGQCGFHRLRIIAYIVRSKAAPCATTICPLAMCHSKRSGSGSPKRHSYTSPSPHEYLKPHTRVLSSSAYTYTPHVVRLMALPVSNSRSTSGWCIIDYMNCDRSSSSAGAGAGGGACGGRCCAPCAPWYAAVDAPGAGAVAGGGSCANACAADTAGGRTPATPLNAVFASSPPPPEQFLSSPIIMIVCKPKRGPLRGWSLPDAYELTATIAHTPGYTLLSSVIGCIRLSYMPGLNF